MIKQYIIVFFISMLPFVELRLAVPFAIGMELPIIPSYITAIVGNMIPVPFIFLFARRLLEWGRDKKVIGSLFSWCLAKGKHCGEKLSEKAGRGFYFALFLFVGIPLPGTGVWTGILAASLLDMNIKKSALSCMLGVVLAGFIMGVMSLGVFKCIF